MSVLNLTVSYRIVRGNLYVLYAETDEKRLNFLVRVLGSAIGKELAANSVSIEDFFVDKPYGYLYYNTLRSAVKLSLFSLSG